MKKTFILLCASLLMIACNNPQQPTAKEPVKVPALCVKGTQLMNELGDTVVLKGVSYGWHVLWPRFYNAQSAEHLIKDWGAQVLRASIGVGINDLSVLNRPEYGFECATKVVDAAIENGAYVIVDWHSHSIETASYYAAISDAAQKPLVIYSIPAFSGVNITHDNIKTIIDASGAEGLKYTSYDLFELERIHRAHPELTLFNGHDEVYANALPIGLSGAIGSTFNLMPGKYKAIREAYEKGDQAAVSQKQAKVNVLIDTLIAAGVNPGIKYLLTKIGVMDFGGCRPPFGAITEEKKALLDAVADEIFAN